MTEANESAVQTDEAVAAPPMETGSIAAPNVSPADQPKPEAGADEAGKSAADTADKPKTEDGKDKAETAKAKPETAPETYEFKMPEGMPLDEAAAAELSTYAKDHKLSQTEVDAITKIGIDSRLREAEIHAKQVEAWSKEMREDPDLGGEKFSENLGVARKAMQTYCPEGLKAVLVATGLDRHPDMYRMMHAIGRTLQEDTTVRGTPGAGKADPAHRMFPDMK